MRWLGFVLILTIYLIFPSSIYAEVVINEINSNGDPEWIELYRTDESTLNLEGCTLSMGSDSQKILFTSSNTFASNYFLITKGEYGWNSNWLSNEGDLVSLTCPTGTNSVPYGNEAGAFTKAPSSTESIGRSPDGSSSFYILSVQTPNSENSSPPTPTPKPTEAATPTSKPEDTDTPTPSPKPTATKKVTSTPKITQTKNVQESEIDLEPDEKKEKVDDIRDDVVLGAKDEKENEKKESKPFPFFAIVMIGIGLFFVGISGYAFWKNNQKESNLKDSEETEL